jgi:hypothetical protein
MNCLRFLGRWDRGFESHLRHGCVVCLCVYSVFVLSCVYVAALRRAHYSSKESYRLWKMITELSKRPGPWMGWKSHWKKRTSFKRECFGLLIMSLLPCMWYHWQFSVCRKWLERARQNPENQLPSTEREINCLQKCFCRHWQPCFSTPAFDSTLDRQPWAHNVSELRELSSE